MNFWWGPDTLTHLGDWSSLTLSFNSPWSSLCVHMWTRKQQWKRAWEVKTWPRDTDTQSTYIARNKSGGLAASPAVHGLRIHTSTAGDAGSSPGQGTKIPHALHWRLPGLVPRDCLEAVACSGPQNDTAFYTLLAKHCWLIVSSESHDNVRNTVLLIIHYRRGQRGQVTWVRPHT